MIKNFIRKNFTPNDIRGEGQTNVDIISFQCEGRLGIAFIGLKFLATKLTQLLNLCNTKHCMFINILFHLEASLLR